MAASVRWETSRCFGDVDAFDIGESAFGGDAASLSRCFRRLEPKDSCSQRHHMCMDDFGQLFGRAADVYDVDVRRGRGKPSEDEKADLARRLGGKGVTRIDIFGHIGGE